ncbi:MAG: choice-of-anchor Q domain-containing protein, partial [Myxococcota bacterium]
MGSSVLPQVRGYLDLGGNTVGNARLRDPIGGDFRLAAGSPGIDAANSDFVRELDADGVSRLDDSGTPNTGSGSGVAFADIGAYEFVGTTTLRITSPSGGETLTAGAVATLEWEGSATGSVNIEVSTDDGLTYSPLTTGVDAQSGTRSVTLPMVGAPKARLRIVDVSGAVLDQVDDSFAIALDGDWYVNPSATSHDGESFATGFASIDDALEAAVFGQTVRVVEGTYWWDGDGSALVAMKDGVALVGGDSAAGAYDPVAYPTILEGLNVGGTERVNNVVVGANAELRGFTVRDGWAIGEIRTGGGLLVSNVSTVVDECVFLDNRSLRGAAIGLQGSASELLITRSRIEGSRDGPGIYASGGRLHSVETDFIDGETYGIFSEETELVVDGGTFAGNSNFAIDADDRDIVVTDVSIEGRGVRFENANVTVERVAFRDSLSTALFAQGEDGHVVNVSNCVFDDPGRFTSQATAIMVSRVAVNLVNSTIYSTSARPTFDANNGSVFTVVNSIVWNTEAGQPLFEDDNGLVTHSIVHEDIGGTGNSVVDPLFRDAANGDLRLTSGSPAVDAAEGSLAPSTDLLGNSRTPLP